ncbi:MAG: hypothetical protein KGH86_01980 [Thaumarchaeota archaeon]|nr:hypothetical protein [Nitrososphaerota archaeon]MDE1817658.1 hypothetical protein [Nitrososphaerota archaeon]MDE1875589.1 hypothetical protein [Nitrososphaerota archaeon]
MNKKIIGVAIGAGAAIAIAVTFFVLLPQLQTGSSSTIQSVNPAHNPKLGLVIMPPTQKPTLEEIRNAYAQAASTGIGRSNVYLSWPIMEPSQGTYNWGYSDILMGLNREQGLNVTLYFSVINNQLLGPFPSWMGKPQLDQKLQDQTVTTLDAILSRYYIVDYVIIGGNVDSYFRDHPSEIPQYVDFFNGVYEKLKLKHPTVKFGNWFSLNDVVNHAQGDIVGKLSQGDFVAYSYAPVDLLYDQSNSTDNEGANLQKMIDFAQGKKIALMEIGWSTDKSINGTEEDQQKFVKIVYDFYKKNQSDFEFLTWYRQYDRPVDTCYNSLNQADNSIFANNEVLNNTAAYLCGSGLFDVNKNPKPAWDELKQQIQSIPNS